METQNAIRHLTWDEVQMWLGDPYRVRVWQGAFVSPVVLVSQVVRGSHPRADITAIANYVLSAILRFPELGVSVFMDGEGQFSVGTVVRHRILEYVMFDTFGHRLRTRLFKPAAVRRDWKFLEDLVGNEIQR